MNITFMIGNGFDVNLGLKTKFTDFYDTYFRPELDRDVPDSVKNFIQLVLKDKEKFGNMDKWSDFEKAFGENVEGTVEEAGDILEDFTIQFAEHLRKEDEKCSYSNENLINEFEKFLFSSYTFLQKSKKQFVENLIKSSPFLSLNFINFNYTSTLEELITRTDIFLSGFTSFGKTNNKNISKKYTIQSVLHIHGDLNSNIIIGVNGVDQIKRIIGPIKLIEELTAKRSINILSREQHRELKFNSIIDESDLIYMYGLSIGETDKNRWDVIKAWLQKNRNHKLIYFAYDARLKNLNEIFIQKMARIHNQIIYEILLKLGFTQSEFENYFDQIFIIDSNAVLNFKLVDENKETETTMN